MTKMTKTMSNDTFKLFSWNVNGIRSIVTKNKQGKKHDAPISNNTVTTLIEEQAPDVLCLQEIRCGESLNLTQLLQLENKGYHVVGQNCSKVKAGYSGTLVVSRLPIMDVIKDFPQYAPTHPLNGEGRCVTVEFAKFVLINVYVPNAQPGLTRLDFRVNEWELAMRQHIEFVSKKYNKPIVLCGDMNVAPKDIDVHNPKTVKGKHGFTVEEKQAFSLLLTESNMIDSFRHIHPNKVAFSWWSNFAKSRERNVGWRIDMFLVSSTLSKKIKDADIHGEYFGSDHAPISVSISL